MIWNRFFSLVAVAVLVCHVTTRAEEPPYRSPEPIDVKPGFTLEKVTLTERNIPTLLLSKDGDANQKKPIVFLLHGGGAPDVVLVHDVVAKERWFLPEYYDVPYTLAEGGLIVVIIDLWWAGERFKPEYQKIVKNNYLESVIRGFVETTKDISLLIDALSERDDVDASRIGSTGRSGGGIISLMAAATDPRVTAVTSWVGSANLVGMAHEKMPARMVEHFLSRAPGLDEVLQEFDPILRLEHVPPTAVLMMNNRTDPDIPLAVATQLHTRLQPLYADMPERLELRVLETDTPTHVLQKQDYNEGCAWLVKHLNASTD